MLFVRQLELIGSTTHTRSQFEEAIEYVFDGTIEPIIQDTLPFDRYDEALEKMANRDVYGKIVLAPE